MSETLVGAIIGAIAGALLTGICTWIIETRKRKLDKKAQESHAASMLYNDLKSVENYLEHERSSVNIRYTTTWQEMISNCNFLDDEEISYLYKVYDEVYNYNYHYMLIEKKEAVCKERIEQYHTLQKMFGIKEKTEKGKTYDDIMHKLEIYKNQ